MKPVASSSSQRSSYLPRVSVLVRLMLHWVASVSITFWYNSAPRIPKPRRSMSRSPICRNPSLSASNHLLPMTISVGYEIFSRLQRSMIVPLKSGGNHCADRPATSMAARGGPSLPPPPLWAAESRSQLVPTEAVPADLVGACIEPRSLGVRLAALGLSRSVGALHVTLVRKATGRRPRSSPIHTIPCFKP